MLGGARPRGLVGPACCLAKGKMGRAGKVGAGLLGGAERGSCSGWAAGREERERPSSVEPKEREKGQAGQKPGKETFSFDFVFLLFQNHFQIFSKEFEFILNFSRNHSSQ